MQIEYCHVLGPGRHWSRKMRVDCGLPLLRTEVACWVAEAPDIAPAYGHVAFHLGVPESVLGEVRRTFGLDVVPLDEGYVLQAGEGIEVYADTERGLFYGWQTLQRHGRDALLPQILAYEAPVCPVRGVKLLLPSLAKLDEFKRFIDLLAAYKYNTVMLEVGGAMEYRRHPEIGEAWVRYCREMNEYPGKTHKVQGGFGWCKNSIHSGNGGGGVLPQRVVGELVDYCRERYMTVIPEVPLLSHSDYLLMAHPELRERAEDPYPDTYCPSHPDTYRLVFDVLDEVMDVFAPEVINTGHDEWYSFGLCERCRGGEPAVLYAEDIRGIRDYLAARGVRTLMWGEKLLNSHYLDGEPIGGAERSYMPATYRAIDLVPRDLEILHWYWGINRAFEQAYLERGFPVVFGNFVGSIMPEWRRRIGQQGVRGAIISNWGETDQITLQRNGILFEVAYTSLLFWNRRYGDADFEELRNRTFEDLVQYRRCSESRGGAERPRIVILHTTDMKKAHVEYVDGTTVDSEEDLLGHWIIRYADGTTHAVPIVYGQNISAREADWSREMQRRCDAYIGNASLSEVAYTTYPRRIGVETWYEFDFVNPRPGQPVTGIELSRKVGGDAGIFLHSFSVNQTE